MPSDPPGRYAPDIATKMAVLQAKVTRTSVTEAELPIEDLPVECRLGASAEGAAWITIRCDPRSVSVDDDVAAVTFTIIGTGYQMRIAPSAPEAASNHLLEEIVELLSNGHAPGDVGLVAIRNWRELLARPAGDRLSDQALVGLHGELEVLETILEVGGDLDHWTGWNKDHCDFRLSGLVIEVKSTTSSDYRRVRVHGLAQLDDPQDGSDLLLVLKRLESSPDGRSVPDLVERVVALGAARSRLLEKLAGVGYYEHHNASYENKRFVSKEAVLRDIDDSHPRLIASMLTGVEMSSVDKIEYELNLNGTADADIDQTIEELLVERLGNA
jgi:hypothetical protein